jgi:hypothetical protein
MKSFINITNPILNVPNRLCGVVPGASRCSQPAGHCERLNVTQPFPLNHVRIAAFTALQSLSRNFDLFAYSAMTIFNVIPVLKRAGYSRIHYGLRGSENVRMPDNEDSCASLKIAKRWICFIHQHSDASCVLRIFKTKNNLTHRLCLILPLSQAG